VISPAVEPENAHYRLLTIEAGKLADLTVLREDPLRVTSVRIKDIRVAMTIVGGEVRFKE